MKLDRNINPLGYGKYALVLMRKMLKQRDDAKEIRDAFDLLVERGIIDFGNRQGEFFVVRLKDENAGPALDAYAKAALVNGDAEFAREVSELATRAHCHESKQKPD